MDTRVTAQGVRLDLPPSEYGFLYLALSHVLPGQRMADHDFRNILGLEGEAAEALLNEMQAAEDEAKQRGDHWHLNQR